MTLEIQNLKCGGCSATIQKKLSSLSFVKSLEINVEDSTVQFDALDPEDLARVQRKLSEMGYPVNEEPNSLGKKAKSYVSCALGRFS